MVWSGDFSGGIWFLSALKKSYLLEQDYNPDSYIDRGVSSFQATKVLHFTGSQIVPRWRCMTYELSSYVNSRHIPPQSSVISSHPPTCEMGVKYFITDPYLTVSYRFMTSPKVFRQVKSPLVRSVL